MNKLVIIGNGFDLAHGLPTSYKDFLLWEINEAFRTYKDHKIIKSPLFTIESDEHIYNHLNSSEPFIFKSIDEFKSFLKKNVVEKKIMMVDYSYQFIKNLFELAKNNWVDIEKEYYKVLIGIYTDFEKSGNLNIEALKELNKGLDLIKIELKKYLSTISTQQMDIDLPPEIVDIFRSNMISDMPIANNENIYFLNFNYTNTIINYINKFRLNSPINYIHGKLKDKDNPIIFGYGDETDENYEKIEKLNDNEFLKHMKSFAYLQTPNYKNLFSFLDKKDELFEVHIMGHSCGLSDRLLFTHILEHPNLNSVKLYFYEYFNEEKKVVENDFFKKTQELSRYFRKDEKHKMRKVIVPFNESKPLTTYKP